MQKLCSNAEFKTAIDAALGAGGASDTMRRPP
jgi:hypothetical protein